MCLDEFELLIQNTYFSTHVMIIIFRPNEERGTPVGKWLFILIQLHRTIESVETLVSTLISYILYMIHCCLDEMEYF